MKIEDVMTRDVRTCRASDTLDAAAKIMWDHDCGCVPVVDDAGQVLGMLTDRDLCMAAYTQSRPLDRIPVSTAMSKAVYACAPGDTLEAAEHLMKREQVRRLPVLGFQGQLVGILSLNDLARAVASRRRDRSAGATPEAVEATLAAVCRPRTRDILPA